MSKKVIRLSEAELRDLVNGSVDKVLLEVYRFDLYHFTNLGGIYGILGDNCLSAIEVGDDDLDGNNRVVCLSRTANPCIGYCPNVEHGLIFRITLDGDKMVSSIRGMKIRPWSMNNPRTVVNDFDGKVRYQSVSDYEERAYGDIYPFDRYCKAIDVFTVDGGKEFDDDQVVILDKLKKVFPKWVGVFGF